MSGGAVGAMVAMGTGGGAQVVPVQSRNMVVFQQPQQMAVSVGMRPMGPPSVLQVRSPVAAMPDSLRRQVQQVSNTFGANNTAPQGRQLTESEQTLMRSFANAPGMATSGSNVVQGNLYSSAGGNLYSSAGGDNMYTSAGGGHMYSASPMRPQSSSGNLYSSAGGGNLYASGEGMSGPTSHQQLASGLSSGFKYGL